VLTLFVIPAMYSFLSTKKQKSEIEKLTAAEMKGSDEEEEPKAEELSVNT
jgi:hypothetical protein